MIGGVIWESISAHHFDAGFLREWRFQFFLLLCGFIVALPGTTLQWLIPRKFPIFAIAFGFLFSIALVAGTTWCLVTALRGSGAAIGYVLAALVFAPPAALGGIISGILRIRDSQRASAAAEGSL